MPETSEPAAATEANSAETSAHGKSVLFYAVIAVAVIYCGSLIGLALFTANPVVLNPVQLRTSSLIVSGSFQSSEKRGVTVKITEVLKGSADGQEVFIRELSPSQLSEGELWILPLTRVSPKEFIVTPLMNATSPGAKPLLYPADPETLNKVKTLLSPDDPAL